MADAQIWDGKIYLNIFTQKSGSSVLFLAFFLQPRGEERQVPTTEGRSAAPAGYPLGVGFGTTEGLRIFYPNTQCFTSWWFQPIWKILVKLYHFPR